MKSTDGGRTWAELRGNPGLPKGTLGNIGLAVSPANPRRLWAMIEADSGGVFRSDDAGATWTRTNDERKLRQRAWYYSRVFADPKDTNVVYALNVSFYRSADGGRTFKAIPTPHGDDHDLWIAPNDPQRMVEGNDGGANVSVNGGKAWTDQQYATAQFYHVTTTNEFPYRVCGAQQDNSTLCGPVALAGRDHDEPVGGRGRRRERLHRRRPARTPTCRTPGATAGCSRARTCAPGARRRSTRGPTTRWGSPPGTSPIASSGPSRSSSARTTPACCTRRGTTSSAPPTRGGAGRSSRRI
jgi:hypothetical protein